MSRGLTFQTIQRNGAVVLVGSTHLESFLSAYSNDGVEINGSREREAQLMEIREFVARACESGGVDLVIVGGDMNHDDHEKASSATNKHWNDFNVLETLGNGWRDAYIEAAGGGDFNWRESVTYDGQKNPMLGNSLKARWDRILYFVPASSRVTVSVEQCEVNGKETVAGAERQMKKKVNPVTASDHYGVRAVFNVAKKSEE